MSAGSAIYEYDYASQLEPNDEVKKFLLFAAFEFLDQFPEFVDDALANVTPGNTQPPGYRTVGNRFIWDAEEAFMEALKHFAAEAIQQVVEHQRKKPLPAATRWTVWERDNFTCLHCGTRRDLTIDHIVPRSKNGTHDEANLQTLCRRCNSRKGAR